MSEPASTPAAAPAAAAPAAAAASSSTPAPLSGADNLTKLMLEKSLNTLCNHRQLAHRGLGMIYRNLFGILFGSLFAMSWENQIAIAEQKNSKITIQKINVESIRRMKVFFEGKKAKAKSGSCISVAIINPSAKTESFEHRLLLIWLGGRLFKIDGMKRDGIPGFEKDKTTWPAAVTELPEGGAALWKALQVFITAENPKVDWSKEKAEAFDVIVGRPSGSVAFGANIPLKGPQTFCAVTNDEEGLEVSLQNGLVERLKAITAQLEAIP